MSRKLIYLPEVARDVAKGKEYYEKLSHGHGGVRFETAVGQVVGQIEAGLVTHMRVFENFHRVLLPRFPYVLYYRLVEHKAVITAILYARFDPKTIENCLEESRWLACRDSTSVTFRSSVYFYGEPL